MGTVNERNAEDFLFTIFLVGSRKKQAWLLSKMSKQKKKKKSKSSVKRKIKEHKQYKNK